MKKITLLTVLLISFIVNIAAQQSVLVGEWLLEKTVSNKEVKNPYQITNFSEDGNLIIMGIPFATWKYNQGKKIINLHSDFDKSFNGQAKIQTLTKQELTFTLDGKQMYFTKINTSGNANSGLVGTWTFLDVPYAGVNTFITFKAPDAYTFVQKDGGMTTTINGTWYVNLPNKTLILTSMGGENFLKGKSKLLGIDGNNLTLQNDKNVYKATKEAQNKPKIVHLSFTEADFYDANGDYKYEDEDQKLPWHELSIDGIQNTYASIDSLVYTYKTLVENTGVFEEKILTAKPQVNLEGNEAQSVTFEYIFNGYDRNSVPKDYELSVEKLSQYSSPLFPLKSDTFRVTGEEEITIPAGTFTCTVVEAMGKFDELQKIWLINDMPGIVAKLIKEKPGDFSYYHLYELQKIIKKQP